VTLSPPPGREPTPREMDILKVLWDQGSSSVRGVHRHLMRREPDLAYNTVQTILRIMEDKGLVGHISEGRTFVYSALFTRDQSMACFLERVFDGAASQLVSSLLRNEQVSAEELDEMNSLIAQARRRDSLPRKEERK
jgi:BlaI family transcriptional regulator, penicillinase repressor